MTWIMETLFASTLLIAGVLVLRRPTDRLFGPHAAYLLWALPALRMLLPPIPGGAPADIPLPRALDLASSYGSPTASVSEPALFQQVSATGAPLIGMGTALVALWLAGAAIHMTWHIIRYRRFIRRAIGSQGPVRSLDGMQLYHADVAGPAAAGIVRRRILLPHDFADRFNPAEQRLALDHELAHHRRGDLVANWLALAVLSLHWFNPLAHLAYRAFRADQELACDATVLGNASRTERHAYASAVVKAAWAGSPVAACPMNSAGQLKTRLSMMKRKGMGRPRRLAGAAVVGVVAVAAMHITASRTVAMTRVEPAPRPPIPVEDRTVAVGARATLATAAAVAATPPAAADHAAINPATAPDLKRARSTDRIESRVVAAPAVRLAVAGDASAPLFLANAEAMADPDLTPIPVHAALPAPALPEPEMLKGYAAQARKAFMASTHGLTVVRNVRAVLVDGRFNAAEPGATFVGFCGELQSIDHMMWRPFFVSATTSRAVGQAVKCAAVQSQEDYSAYFQPAPGVTASERTARRSICTADRDQCMSPFVRQVFRSAMADVSYTYLPN